MAGWLTSIKNAASTVASAIGSGIKTIGRVAGVVAFSVGRIFGELGSTLFSVTNTVNYIFKKEDPPFKLFIIIPFAYANLFVNAAIRVPSLVSRFGKPHKPDNEPTPLNKKGKAIYYSLTTTGLLSALFSAAKSYLDGMVLLEFVNSQIHHNDPDHKNTPVVTYLIVGGACALAVSKFVSYYYYNFVEIRKNAQHYAEELQDGKFGWDRNMSLTLAFSCLNLLSCIPLGYFSMDKAMNKMPGIKYAPANLKKAIAGFSAVTQMVSTATSSVPTLHARIASYNADQQNEMESQPQQPIKAEITAWWGAPLKANTLFYGVVDTLREIAGNVAAMALTTEQLLHANPYHPAIITVAFLTAASSGALGYTFGVLKGWDGLVTIWVDGKEVADPELAHNGYQPLPCDDDIEGNVVPRSRARNINGFFDREEDHDITAQTLPTNSSKVRKYQGFFASADEDDRDIPLARSLPRTESRVFDYSLRC